MANASEVVARAVLRELPDKDMYSLRDRAEDAPVSRGTISRWDEGEYGMKKATMRQLVEWLNQRGVDPFTKPSASHARSALQSSDKVREELDDMTRDAG
jgi:predicted transcriptional regulator